MSVAVILVIILAVLFGLTFFTKRRFGVLGLALAAGAILSNMWASDLTPVVRQSGFEIISPPLSTVVAAFVVLLPPIILFFSGPTYKNLTDRVVGAAAFALLALAFLLPILGDALVITASDGLQVYNFVTSYRIWIVTAGLLFAVFDILRTKSHKAEKEKH